jgi:hypothetical protein
MPIGSTVQLCACVSYPNGSNAPSVVNNFDTITVFGTDATRVYPDELIGCKKFQLQHTNNTIYIVSQCIPKCAIRGRRLLLAALVVDSNVDRLEQRASSLK